jgi:hypothetical protein
MSEVVDVGTEPAQTQPTKEVIVVGNNVVNKNTMQTIYKSKLQASLLKFLRSVTLQPITLDIRIVDNPHMVNAPAWSNDTGAVLVHNSELGSIGSASNIMRLKGLAIHELSHLVYTPRSRTHFFKWVVDKGYTRTFNLLEDNRIENLMVARMSGVAPWLTTVIIDELVKAPDSKQSSLLPLLWGRKYLPQSLRLKSLAEWPQDNGQVIADILDKYILLNVLHKADQETAKVLISEMHEAIGSNRDVPETHHGTTTVAPDSAGTDMSPTKREIDKQLKEVTDTMQQDNDTAGDGDGDEDGEDNGISGGGGSLKDELYEAVQTAKDAVYEDVKNTVESLRDVNSQTNFSEEHLSRTHHVIKPVQKWQVQYESVSSEMMSASKLFARELNELRAEHDPAWMRKVDQGRLNVREFIMNGNLDESFDLWDDGNEAVTDIECVILLDNSGSMRDMITSAYESMWAIKRALDSVSATTTVIQFGTYGDILYTADQAANTKMVTARYAGGGSTNPLNSIIKAQDILANSSRGIKMFIMITDGEWASAVECDQVIATMRSQSVLTGLVFLEEPTENNWYKNYDENGARVLNAHCCEVLEKIENPRDILKFAKGLAKLSRNRLLSI